MRRILLIIIMLSIFAPIFAIDGDDYDKKLYLEVNNDGKISTIAIPYSVASELEINAGTHLSVSNVSSRALALTDKPDRYPNEHGRIVWKGTVDATLVRQSDSAYGGTFGIGYRVGNLESYIYGRYTQMMKPLGSSSGQFGQLEIAFEPGFTFRASILKQGRTEIYLGADIGYYMQYIQTATDTYTSLTYNGLMLRPTVSYAYRIGKKYSVELSLFYQAPISPAYTDYNGWGVSIGLF